MRRSLLALALAACGAPPAKAPAPTTAPPTTTTTPATPPSSEVIAPSVGNAPEISRSVGVEGGVIILWPRISGAKDATSRELAAQIQQHLVTLVARAAPGKPVDTRPEPERACSRQGCKAVSVGAVLLREGTACAVVAMISPGGPSSATLVPWAADITLRSPTSKFREAPEPAILVRDFSTCSTIVSELPGHDAEVEAAIRQLVR